MSDDLADLDSLLRSALRTVNNTKNLRRAKEEHKTARDISEDYAARLAEKATFRRLLSDEALDGVRFRWLFVHRDKWPLVIMNPSLDQTRKWIDGAIQKEDSERG